ncbi:MAG: hypothetical protein DLM57_18155 [Pseudonocardiales bacterium]|nr:MAG: hypothetical protein DLM57_18155 [Pseudonocardiales bacterium]
MTETQRGPREKAAGVVRGFVDELRSRVLHGLHQHGFDDAARTCLSVIDKQINDLNDKSRSSRGKLNQQDQYLLTILGDIRAEMASELDGNSEGIDRP